MVRRGRSARFLGGAWVFPGGVVDEVDGGELARSVVSGGPGEEERRWVAAGLRELAEEVDIWITTEPLPARPEGRLRGAAVYEELRRLGARFDAGRAAYFANWITPTTIPLRFDTRFYAVAVAEAAVPDPDPEELDAAEWLEPAAGLEQARAGERTVPFPTKKTLQHLAGFSTADEVLADARALDDVPPVLARARIAADGTVEVVLPWEPGYDDLGDLEPDPEALTKLARAAAAEVPIAGDGADDEG